MSNQQRLVLFDIDGTLLSAAGAGRIALGRALRETVGDVPAVEKWVFAGKTDPQLTRELLLHHGIADEEIARLTEVVLDRYLEHLEPELAKAADAHIKPGVEVLLQRLGTMPDVCVGLLTGNLEVGAHVKLRHFGLLEYFRVGAFGSDHADRRELPAIAASRATGLAGTVYTGKQIVIIGDTEHDILCGQSLGVRAMGVCTGPYSAKELLKFNPDIVFEDLSDTASVLTAILAPYGA